MNRARDQMCPLRARRPAALAVSRIRIVRTGVIGESARQPTGTLQGIDRREGRATTPILAASRRDSAMVLRRASALLSRSGRTAMTPIRQAPVRSGAARERLTTPDLDVGRMAPARGRPDLARDLVGPELVLMVLGVVRALAVAATMGHLSPMARPDLVPVGVTGRLDLAVPMDHRHLTGRAARRACLGMMGQAPPSAVSRDRMVHNGRRAVSDDAAAQPLAVLVVVRHETVSAEQIAADNSRAVPADSAVDADAMATGPHATAGAVHSSALAVLAGQWVSEAAQGSVLAGVVAVECATDLGREDLLADPGLTDRVASGRSDSVANRDVMVSPVCVPALVLAAVAGMVRADRSGPRLVLSAASRASAQEVLAARRTSAAVEASTPAAISMDRTVSVALEASPDRAVSLVPVLTVGNGMAVTSDPDHGLPASKAREALATVLAVATGVVDRRAASAAMAAAPAPMVQGDSAGGVRTGHRALRAEWVADQLAMAVVVLAVDFRDLATLALTPTMIARRPMQISIVVRRWLASMIPRGIAIERR
jgi:hypothetical protein